MKSVLIISLVNYVLTQNTTSVPGNTTAVTTESQTTTARNVEKLLENELRLCFDLFLGLLKSNESICKRHRKCLKG